MTTIARLCVTAACVGVPVAAVAQPAPSRAEPTVVSCTRKQTLNAVAQSLGVNIVVNRANAWVFGYDWAHVGFKSWARNLDRGWKWDANQFTTNMFVHPYHGSLYFNAARASCLNFWESVPIAFLGSWEWEYFGETFRPSLNDFYMTGFGGPILGEVLNRVSAAILDEEADGGERIGRELAALVINPVGGLNRLVRGQWTRHGVNPPDRIPDSYLFQAKLGARRVEEVESENGVTTSPTLLLDVSLGDVFDTPYRQPLDVVHMLAQVSPDGGGLNLLRIVGRLYGRELTAGDGWQRHELLINQRFDYINNPVYHFGEQSLEVGVQSLWRTGPGGFRLSTRLAGDAVMLGAIEALAPPGVDRTIDWGPGVGAIAEVSFERDGQTYFTWYNRVRYLRAVSGDPANHTLLFSGFDVTIPLTSQLGVGAYLSGDHRYSHYGDRPDIDRSYIETRFYLTWTLGHRTPDPTR